MMRLLPFPFPPFSFSYTWIEETGSLQRSENLIDLEHRQDLQEERKSPTKVLARESQSFKNSSIHLTIDAKTLFSQ